jgi:hypothetical protein
MANLTLSSPSYTAREGWGSVLSGGSGQVANPFPTNGTWTIEGRIRCTPSGGIQVVFGAASTMWAGCDGAGNAMARYGTNGAGEVSFSTSVPVADNQDHHCALALGPSGGRLYIDGVLAGSSATTAEAAGVVYTSDFGVRTFPGTGFGWTGSVDEVAVWSTERYTEDFTPPSAPYANGTAGLVSLWHLDGNGVDTAGPATAVTLSGPSSGTVGVASTNFTVGANGGITGTVTVTPSDGGAGGTFSPTSVAISSGTPTATFTYTPSTTGARSISVTNDGGLTNPTPITYTATASGATAVTLSGPSSGTVGVASTNFTVGANGAITGTVTVTPSDGGAGGTFSPTSVAISSGTPTATFTYTPSTTGARSISVTNNGGLTNPSPITYTATAGGVIPPDHAAILYSPYNWHVNGTRAQTIYAGAYFRVLFTGGSCDLNFDMSNVSSPVPRLLIRVDGRTRQSANLASTVSVTMPSGQDNTTHVLDVEVDATTETVNRWNPPQNTAVKLTGITLASGSDTVSAPQPRPFNLLTYGDSTDEGVRTLALNGTNDVDRNSASVCWPLELGRLLGAEVGSVGFGSQGISDPGNGNVPNLRNAWDLLWSGQARSFDPAPDYCVWLHGINDGANNTVADGIAALNGMLAAMPGTQFFLFRPLTGNDQAANLQAIAAGCSDPGRVRYIDTTGYWQASESSDGLHPYGWACLANIAPRMAQAIRTPASRTTRTVTVTLTGLDGTTPVPNLTGLRWAFFDSPQPQSFAAPASQGTGETTDGSGVLTMSVETTLPTAMATPVPSK